MALIFGPLCRPTGSLPAKLGPNNAVEPGSREYMGMNISPDGYLLCTIWGPTNHQHGLPFRDGLLCVGGGPVAYVQDSVPFNASGRVVVVDGGVEDVVTQGVPFDSGGAIIIEVPGAPPVAAPPEWTGIPALEHFDFELLQTFDVSPYAIVNSESGPVTSYAINPPVTGFSIDAQGVVTCAQGTAPAQYTLNLDAINAQGTSSPQGVLSWLIKQGQVPVWPNGIPDLTHSYDSVPRIYAISPYVSSPDAPVTAYTLVDAPDGFTIPNPSVGEIQVDESVIVSAYTIQVTATNAAGTSFAESFTWTVTAPSSVPVWSPVGPFSSVFSIGPSTESLTPYVNSPNPANGEPTNYQLVSGHSGFTLNSTTGDLTCAPTVPIGEYTLEVSADNNYGRGYSAPFTWSVSDVEKYEFEHDFTTTTLGPFVYTRTGDATAVSSEGLAVGDIDNVAQYNGSDYFEGVGWSPSALSFGLQIEQPGYNNCKQDSADASHWTPTNVTLDFNSVIYGYIPGMEITEDTSTGVHSVGPSAAVDNVSTLWQIGDRLHYITGVLSRGTTFRRYINIVSTLRNSTTQEPYDGTRVSVCIDLKTWQVVETMGDDLTYYYVRDVQVWPLKDGKSAWVSILGRLEDDPVTGLRDLEVTIEGASSPSATPGQSYTGSGERMCGWYGQTLEGMNNADVGIPVAFQGTASRNSWYIPYGGQRSNSGAVMTVPATPGSRQDEVYAQCVFRLPKLNGKTTEAGNIFAISTTSEVDENRHSISIKTHEFNSPYPAMKVGLIWQNVGQATLNIPFAGLQDGDILDVRMMRRMDTGFTVLWAVNPAYNDPEDPTEEPTVEWERYNNDNAGSTQPFSVPMDKVNIGATVTNTQPSETIDVVLVRYGFSPLFTEDDLRAFPIWTPSVPEVLAEPEDQEIQL